MMRACATLFVVFAIALPAGAASKKVSREETVELFAGLAAAAKTAKTFQAKTKRSTTSGFLIDEKPEVSEGRWYVRRLDRAKVGKGQLPLNYRRDTLKPSKGSLIITDKDFWVHFPEDREAQHVDLSRGGAGGRIESFTLWLYFDLDAVEKTYRVKVREVDPLEGVAYRQGADGDEVSPERMYRITFEPRDEETATFVSLKLWVAPKTPWPLKLEKETDDATVTTEFSEVVLDAPIKADVFEFVPPRGTKVQELGE